MKSTIVKENTEMIKAEKYLSSPYSENVEEVKAEIIFLGGIIIHYVKSLINDEAVKKGKILREFFHPYREDFKIIDAYTEKIDSGVKILSQKLSVKQYRADNEYGAIQELVSILEKELIPELERKQERKKKKNMFILIATIIFHILIYGWLLL